MKPKGMEIRIRTTGELSTLGVFVGAILALMSIVSLLLVKTFIGAAVILLIPIIYCGACCLIARREKNALVMNVISVEGVKNSYMGNVLCDLSWSEIGDFGVVEVKKGLFHGRYIYMSRIFVQSSVRKDAINRYDPRVCVIFPYTADVCRAVMRLSGGRIDIR